MFEYELNKLPVGFYNYQDPGIPSDGSVGGLRIKKISTYSSNSEFPLVKSYEYVPQTLNYYRRITPSLYIHKEEKYYVYNESSLCLYWSEVIPAYYALNQPLLPIVGTGGQPIVYSLLILFRELIHIMGFKPASTLRQE